MDKSTIRQTKSAAEPLSNKEIDNILRTIEHLAREPESTAQMSLIKLLFPFDLRDKNGGLGAQIDTPFQVVALPLGSRTVSASKPDRHHGYRLKDFNDEQSNAFNAKKPYGPPSTTSNLPFFAVEFKSQFQGDTHHFAENRNAVNGALFVNYMEQILKGHDIDCAKALKKNGTKYSAVDSVAFSCYIDASGAGLWVHWHQGNQYVSAKFGSYLLNQVDDIRRLHLTIRRIVEYGMTTRLDEVKHALERDLRKETRTTRKATAKA
ncbi:hypothetical protein MMC26_001535 [Xylographa opegraphella]|nr:hypothetical protein [Xylographa opegraphella]